MNAGWQHREGSYEARALPGHLRTARRQGAGMPRHRDQISYSLVGHCEDFSFNVEWDGATRKF